MTSRLYTPVHGQTRRNLLAAMQAESLAHATYKLYAARARQSGAHDIAELFERAAEQELHDHFAREAALTELVGSDLDNLRAAVEAERYGAQVLYRDYAAKAAAAGDDVAAALFEDVREDERRHERAFRRALAAALEAADLGRD